MSRRWVPLAPLLLSAILYGASLGNGFVYDDVPLVQQDERLRSVKGLLDVAPRERPVRFISLWIDRALYGDNPAGYHLTNILLHGAVGVLVLLYARALLGGGATLVPLIASLIFVAHPIQTEAVNGISHRKEMLSAIFLLIALLRGRSSPLGPRRAGEIVVWLALGALAKATALAGVPLLLLQRMLPARRGAARSVASRWLPLGTAIVLIGFVAVKGRDIRNSLRLLERAGSSPLAAHNLLLAPRLYPEYFQLFAWPYPLALEREAPRVRQLADPAAWAGLALWLGVVAAAYATRRRPLLSLSLAWIAIAPLPTLNLLPLNFLIADRYLYIPSIGFAWLLAIGIDALAARAPAARRTRLAITMALVILVPSAALVVRRTLEWRSEETLLAATLRDNPTAEVALRRAAVKASADGDAAAATELARRAVDALPTDARSWRALGDAWWAAGRLDSARAAFEEARQRGERGDVSNRLGIIAAREGRFADAAKLFDEALQSRQGDPALRENLGRALIESGELQRGRRILERLVERHPERRDAWGILALSYMKRGELDGTREVIERARTALGADPLIPQLEAELARLEAPGAR